MRSLAALAFLASSVLAQPQWQDWNDALFARAKREHRLVVLHLGAVWCHWCHVMEHETYRDPVVLDVLANGWLCCKVDQDLRPDLANRYQDYGWPATILFDADRHELAKLRGYLPPRRMEGLLRAFPADPTPGPSVTAGSRPTRPSAEPDLERRLAAAWDEAQAGFGTVHKFLDAGTVEYLLERARAGDAIAERRALRTLDAELALLDPVWGGVYQYSDGGVWTNPHFEKIVPRQADDLRCYALAFLAHGNPRHAEALRAIARYLVGFLRAPEGAFWASQDADLVAGEHAAGFFALDAARRAQRGMPRIDKHLYARENGLLGEALTLASLALDDTAMREAALRAVDWTIANRALPGGGFRHDERDAAGPYLADTLAMGRAFWMLWRVTQDPVWSERARAALHFVAATFLTDAGVATAPGAEPDFDENVSLARFAGLVAAATGDAEAKALAGRALGWLRGSGIRNHPGADVGGLLLALRESAREPVHLTVVGDPEDPRTRSLLHAARRIPTLHAFMEVWTPTEAASAQPAYPTTPSPAAYFCADGTCSAPASTARELAAHWQR